MSKIRKPFSLAYDPEATRPGEQVHAEPDPLSADCARRLRDIERAGRLRNVLVSAEFGALESARFRLYTTRDLPAAERHVSAARFYRRLYFKVCRLQARARGEAGS
jgi:hypothetical protein